MDYKLTEEQIMLKTMAGDFLKDKFPKPVVKEIQASETGYSPELWKEMAELGWTGLVIPETYGGSGMSFLDLTILLEEMGRACMPGPFFPAVLLGAYPVLDAGTEEQKQEYLTKIASGTAIFTMAINETDGLYQANSINMRATADGSDFIIDGTKLFVPSANVADYILCVARTGDKESAEEGITVFVVDSRSSGIKTAVLKTLDNEKLCEVVFDKVRVPAANILGGLGKGWELVRRTIERAAIAKCCDILGNLQQVLEMTVQYAKDRQQFGQPIGKFQIVQHYCANMDTDVEGLRFVTYRAAWAWNEGLSVNKEAAVAKAWAAEAGERVMALAHQIHGAIGVTIDHDLQYYTKRFKAASTVYGDEGFCRERVAEEMGL